MWPMLIGAGAGGLLGLGKYELSDKPQYEQQAQLASQMERYSPWTGVHGKMPAPVSASNDILQGLGGGLAQGQSIAAMGGQKAVPSPAPMAADAGLSNFDPSGSAMALGAGDLPAGSGGEMGAPTLYGSNLNSPGQWGRMMGQAPMIPARV